MKRIRARLNAPLKAAGFEFAGQDTRNPRRPASIEFVRPGCILRCVFDRCETGNWGTRVGQHGYCWRRSEPCC